jgi:hypothetical protein
LAGCARKVLRVLGARPDSYVASGRSFILAADQKFRGGRKDVVHIWCVVQLVRTPVAQEVTSSSPVAPANYLARDEMSIAAL